MKKGLFIIFLTAICVAAFASGSYNPRKEITAAGLTMDEDRAKARYYFLQGSVEAAANNMAQAYEYFKKAYELDPGFEDASFTYGNQRLFMRSDTLQSIEELNRSLAMMRAYVDKNPRDLYATQMYGYVSSALDTVEEAVRVYENTYSLMPAETQLLQLLADAYVRTLRPKDAIATLDKYESIEGKSKEVTLKKITILMASQDTVGAINEVESLIRFNPRDPYSVILKGNLYEVIGNMDSVLVSYKEAERLAPSNGAVKMSLANYYRAVGDSVMLDRMIYEALLSEDIELDEKLGILADYLQKLLETEGDRSRGDHLFAVLEEQYPHEPEVLEMSGRYSAAKGDFQAAKEAINYAVDLDPTNEQLWLMLLSFDVSEENYRQAIKDYQKARSHYEPSVRLKNLYAAAASVLDDSKEGETIIRDLLRDEDPRLADNPSQEVLAEVRKGLDYDGLRWLSSLYCMLGDINYKNGHTRQGFQDYENSLYFLSDNPLTLNNFAYFLSEEDQDLEEAKQMSRKSLDLAGDNPTYLDTYAWILYKMGDYGDAMKYIQMAIDMAKEQGDENEEYQKHFEAIQKALDETLPPKDSED